MGEMTNREIERAGESGRDARDAADRHELRPGEVPRAAADRADESKLDGARATDGAGGGQSTGFKRYRAAEQMGWTMLRAVSMDVDEQGQWSAMLALNRATHSMSVLEEALVLREMVTMGMTQTGIGQMLNRHKSWVSRRIGLIERLHPELVEQIREGILPPGAGRRLLGLPPGNQLELATVVTHHDLGSRETELLVRLWRNADPPVRDYLLAHPRQALANARAGDPEQPPDPRLTARGQRLQRHLRILQGVAPRTLQMLRPSPAEEDMLILAVDLESTRSSLCRLMEALGSARPRTG
jgi:ParB-like chromosome segregation protein Spo0J